MKDFTRRDEVVIATKVYGRMRPGPNGAGLSRKAIMSEIDAKSAAPDAEPLFGRAQRGIEIGARRMRYRAENALVCRVHHGCAVGALPIAGDKKLKLGILRHDQAP
jgi:hypothetical protein